MRHSTKTRVRKDRNISIHLQHLNLAKQRHLKVWATSFIMFSLLIRHTSTASTITSMKRYLKICISKLAFCTGSIPWFQSLSGNLCLNVPTSPQTWRLKQQKQCCHNVNPPIHFLPLTFLFLLTTYNFVDDPVWQENHLQVQNSPLLQR